MSLETIVFQVTTKCPLNCPQCYMQKGEQDLDIQTGEQLISVLANDGGCAVQFTGGEPMVYHELSSLIDNAAKNNLYSAVATSGFGCSVEILEQLVQCGLDLLCVSINDIDENKNAITRASYDISLSAIRTAMEVGLPCCVNVVVTDQNIDNIEVLSQYLLNVGVEVISFLRPVKSFDGKYVPSVSVDTIQKLNKLVEANSDRLIVENCFKEYWEYTTQKSFECQDAGDKTIFVNADGTLSPCSQLQQYRYGSIHEMMKDKNLWKGGCCR